MSYTLESRDGALYAKEKRVNEDLPLLNVRWYKLSTSYEEFIAYFPTRAAACRQIGSTLAPTTTSPLVFLSNCGWIFHRSSAGLPEHAETIPIRKPTHHGNILLVWRKGAWCTQ